MGAKAPEGCPAASPDLLGGVPMGARLIADPGGQA